MAAVFAIVGAAVMAVSGQLSAFERASALRGQARARRVQGEQELQSAKRQLRQEMGQAAVAASGSGLAGSSFADVFESQFIEDAEFLGRIQQWTDFDVEVLNRQAKSAKIVGGILGLGGGAAAAAKGVSGALDREKPDKEKPARNIFATTQSPAGPSAFRSPQTATFF